MRMHFLSISDLITKGIIITDVNSDKQLIEYTISCEYKIEVLTPWTSLEDISSIKVHCNEEATIHGNTNQEIITLPNMDIPLYFNIYIRSPVVS